MKAIIQYSLILAAVCLISCDKQKDDLVIPLTASEFPQVITFGDEGDGDLEDEDKFSFVLTLNDRVDPAKEELGGKIVPLTEDVTVNFEVSEIEGLDQIADYIKGATAFYEIDDCTSSADLDIDLNLAFDPATGKGSVTFPKGVEEIEIEFETDDALFDDNDLNEDSRELRFIITGTTGNGQVTWNKAAEFTYEVLDDEAIQGEWELDPENAEQFNRFKTLFGLINEDVANLQASEVDKIVISIEYDEVQVEIELKETELVTECGETEEVNKVIEIEAGLESLDTKTLNGAIEFGDELEQQDGTLKEFLYTGDFAIDGSMLALSLSGEYDDKTTETITLILEK